MGGRIDCGRVQVVADIACMVCCVSCWPPWQDVTPVPGAGYYIACQIIVSMNKVSTTQLVVRL